MCGTYIGSKRVLKSLCAVARGKREFIFAWSSMSLRCTSASFVVLVGFVFLLPSAREHLKENRRDHMIKMEATKNAHINYYNMNTGQHSAGQKKIIFRTPVPATALYFRTSWLNMMSGWSLMFLLLIFLSLCCCTAHLRHSVFLQILRTYRRRRFCFFFQFFICRELFLIAQSLKLKWEEKIRQLPKHVISVLFDRWTRLPEALDYFFQFAFSL